MHISIVGFIMGFILPFVVGRFGKILPATPGVIIVNMFHLPRFPKVYNAVETRRLQQKWLKLFVVACGWGVMMSALFYTITISMPVPVHVFAFIFTWIILTASAVDAEIQLLPDFFTLPLTLLGFLFSTQTRALDISESLAGAFFGYLISIVSVLATGSSKRSEFGAGDVKLLVALGGWLGVIGLNYALILSFLLFVLLSAVRGNKVGAYGPALGLGALFTFFVIYTK